MTWLRRVRVLLIHLLRVWRAGQLRFRLETYGVYYPAAPYASPWWRIRPRYFWLLLRQLRSYGAWMEEMEQLRSERSHAWWTRRYPHTPHNSETL